MPTSHDLYLNEPVLASEQPRQSADQLLSEIDDLDVKYWDKRDWYERELSQIILKFKKVIRDSLLHQGLFNVPNATGELIAIRIDPDAVTKFDLQARAEIDRASTVQLKLEIEIDPSKILGLHTVMSPYRANARHRLRELLDRKLNDIGSGQTDLWCRFSNSDLDNTLFKFDFSLRLGDTLHEDALKIRDEMFTMQEALDKSRKRFTAVVQECVKPGIASFTFNFIEDSDWDTDWQNRLKLLGIKSSVTIPLEFTNRAYANLAINYPQELQSWWQASNSEMRVKFMRALIDHVNTFLAKQGLNCDSPNLERIVQYELMFSVFDVHPINQSEEDPETADNLPAVLDYSI